MNIKLLTQSQQLTARLLRQQQARVMAEAQQAMADLQAAINDLARVYAGEDGWQFAQEDANSPIYLRRIPTQPDLG